MNKKKIIILSVSLLILALILVLLLNLPEKDESVDPGASSSATEVTPEGGIIYSVKHDTITSVTACIAGDEFTFSYDGNSWSCPARPNAELSNSKIGSLIARICSVVYKDKLTQDGVSARDCGITENSDTVAFECEDGTVTLTLGSKVAGADMYYLTASLAEGIYMVDSEIVESVFAPFEEYRSDDFHTVDFKNLASIEIRNEVFEATLERSESNVKEGVYYEWNLTSPISVYARDSEVQAIFIAPIDRLNIDRYVSDDGNFENYGISKDKYISFTDTSGKNLTVYFSDRKDGQYYICVDDKPNIYSVTEGLFPLAGTNLIDIADRQLYLTRNDKIESVTIKGENVDYTIEFKDDEFLVNGNSVTDKLDMNDVFTNIVSLYADDVSTEAVGAPEITITYNLMDSSKITLEFSSKDERNFAVSKNGEPVYVILKNKLDTLYQALDKYTETE